MWILDKGGTCIYNVNNCRELSVVSNFEIGIAVGVGMKEKNYYALGTYANYQRAKAVFAELVRAIELCECQIFRMPKE
ncbi:MAG: hypothetical protein RSG54_08190 [Clostridium sp.]